MYGKKYMGVERTTFVIDGKGIVRQIFPKVKVDGHSGPSSRPSSVQLTVERSSASTGDGSDA